MINNQFLIFFNLKLNGKESFHSFNDRDTLDIDISVKSNIGECNSSNSFAHTRTSVVLTDMHGTKHVL